MISVVCPFYNEESILEKAILWMLGNLEQLSEDWELIVVDDGSTDNSLSIARRLEDMHERLRVVSYAVNRGRGYAIRMGVGSASGDVVVTTEIDGSWGDDIVPRLVRAMRRHVDADIVIASPHLRGGGYKNVPMHRVLLSTLGNFVIRGGLSYRVTMNTGMTRAYRRERFLRLPLADNGKEMHLEIVNKALALNYQIYEIPAVLEWRDHKLAAAAGTKRKSSSRVRRLIWTHLLFSVGAAPFRYMYVISASLFALALGFLAWAVVNLFTPEPSVYVVLIGFMLALIALLLFGIGVLAQQNRSAMQEIWRWQSYAGMTAVPSNTSRFENSGTSATPEAFLGR